MGKITGLYRHAVKGLSADAMEQVHIAQPYDTFPDDRRYALLYEHHTDKFSPEDPTWLHKEIFLCAFTQPKFTSQLETSYQVQLQSPAAATTTTTDGQPRLIEQSYGRPCDQIAEESTATTPATTRRLLTVRDRASQELLCGPSDLATDQGRVEIGQFFSLKSGMNVHVVTAANNNGDHTHQFGNTSSGWKQRQDTRTIHIINAATVRLVSETLGIRLNPTRFRPNIIVDHGWEPFAEFDWIGKSLQIRPNNNKGSTAIRVSLLSKTVRCEGVSIDPLDPDRVVDIPGLLAKHFPQHGPYLGVYAVLDDAGTISLGDEIGPM